jgi:membrane fusion protein (multidrug efflux system)
VRRLDQFNGSWVLGVSGTDDNSTSKDSGRGRLRWVRWPLIIIGPVAIIAAVAWFWVNSARSEITDNAYVQVAKAPVAASIAGRVTDIYVHENQPVKKGQLLFRLDAREYEANVAAAQAAIADAELRIASLRAAYQTSVTGIQTAREQVAFTAREAQRQRDLAGVGVASQQQVDQAVHAAALAREQLAVAQQQSVQALAALGGNVRLAASAQPTVLQAKANLQRQQLNIAYSEVLAPADGIVTRVDQMPVGSYLNASQTAFYLLSGQPWIEANFKEDQLTNMKVGQPVEIHIDAYKKTSLKGHVASFSPGTGAAFSPLPPQNATGNWVKVVQRLPVRIEFDKPPGPEARAGLSAHVKVDTTAPGRAG